MKKVPFFGNTEDGTHGYQACIKMILGYFKPDIIMSYEELNKISRKLAPADFVTPYGRNLHLLSLSTMNREQAHN